MADETPKVVSIFDRAPVEDDGNEILEADRAQTIKALEEAIENVKAGTMIGCVIIGGRLCPTAKHIYGSEIIVAADPVLMAPHTFYTGCMMAANRIMQDIEDGAEIQA